MEIILTWQKMSKLDQIYRRFVLTSFFTRGWGKPENLKRWNNTKVKVEKQYMAIHNRIKKNCIALKQLAHAETIYQVNWKCNVCSIIRKCIRMKTNLCIQFYISHIQIFFILLWIAMYCFSTFTLVLFHLFKFSGFPHPLVKKLVNINLLLPYNRANIAFSINLIYCFCMCQLFEGINHVILMLAIIWYHPIRKGVTYTTTLNWFIYVRTLRCSLSLIECHWFVSLDITMIKLLPCF
jgi:hypothetical protein